jgi:hypothetical protein
MGSYEQRLKLGAVDRPHYGYCVYQAALLARKLGMERISVIEFGVAGGNGLVNLEGHAREVTRLLGVEIDLYGFDTGKGLPPVTDYRDMPYHWKTGFFKMDIPQLRERLKKSTLVLGDIQKTAKGFFKKFNPAPIGALFYDFDLYSSTAAALKMLEAKDRYFLPRLFCYFDDTIGEEELYNDFTGERLAIREFNEAHARIKLAFARHLLARRIQEAWFRQIWIGHRFGHPQYNTYVGSGEFDLSLKNETPDRSG